MSKSKAFTNGREERVARGLGWFSIGLGLAELLAPRSMARLIGVRSHPILFRAFGLREILAGVAVLSERRPVAGLQSRVAGDVLDLAALGAAYMSDKSNKAGVTFATAAVAGVTALDVQCCRQLNDGRGVFKGPIHLEKCVTINRSAGDLFDFWHDFENLPRFMNHLKSVERLGDGRSHWVAKAPLDASVEWDAEITREEPDRLIAWRSVGDGDVANAGEVTFERAPGGRGTVVRVKLDYQPPAGALGAKVAALFGKAPGKEIEVDLRRFKQLMETGEIPTTEGQPAGRPRSTSRRFDDLVQK